jgi:D-threo-aldose 1-dehydrogenase
MDKIQIQDSSVSLSRLGFGCARIFGGTELRASARLLDSAMSCGITHFDTAPSYGSSEDVLGAVLAGVSDVTIATKIGLSRAGRRQTGAARIIGPLYRKAVRPLLARAPALKSRLLRVASRPAATAAIGPKKRIGRDEVLRELEESLRRLRRTRIELFLLHEPEGIEITDELREVFLSLAKDGVIGAYGLAFGAGPTEAEPFGAVVQCRFPGSPHTSICRDATPIYHGVLRFGLSSRERDLGRLGAGALLAGVLREQPRSTVIFSASSVDQIRRIAEGCRT